jgi:hypothetical protein
MSKESQVQDRRETISQIVIAIITIGLLACAVCQSVAS